MNTYLSVFWDLIKNGCETCLVAQILATANAEYPTAQRFRERLASLYGATLSTKVSTKGLVHIIDIELSFMKIDIQWLRKIF